MIDVNGGSDPLTGLMGRGRFQAAAGGLIRKDARGLALVWFDVDNFKLYNRRFGFRIGSERLRDLALILAMTFRGDLVSRFSDDHFVVLTTWVGLEDRIGAAREKLLRKGLRLRAGVYLPSSGDDSETACDRAKLACDSIRRNNSVTFCLYRKDMGQDLLRRKYIVDALEGAIERGDIRVRYQPIVRVLTGRICGTEALARWEDPEQGPLAPGDFIPSLEQYHEIHRLDIQSVRQVCADLGGRQRRGLPLLPISINLSRLDFELCDIFGEVERAVAENSVSKDLLHIEITESVHGEDLDVLRLGIEKFRQNGYEVWMDDFGSGYSSLNTLKDYNFDTIKFDMKFLSDLGKRSRFILDANLSMAKRLGVQSLAEGVETEEQMAYLRSAGFEKAQGYLFGRPMPLDDIFALPLPKENFQDGPYYERLGQIELPSRSAMDRAAGGACYRIADVRGMALYELCGGQLTLLAKNDAFQEPDERALKQALGMGDEEALPKGYQAVFVASKPKEGVDAYLVTHPADLDSR